MHVLLKNLVCYDQNEAFSDEPYIQINGVTVWSGGDVDKGESISINKTVDIGRVWDLYLWERDGGNINDNDLIGSFSSLAYEADTTHDFHGSGAHYRLYYEMF